MTLPATDAFTGSNNTLLDAYSTSWTVNNGGNTGLNFIIQSNCVSPSSPNVDIAAHWNADTFNNNQYSKISITSVTASTYAGVAVRIAAGNTRTFYEFTSSPNDSSYLNKMVAGTQTQLGSSGPSFTAGDTVELRVSGTGLSPRVNNTEVISGQTDSSIASGYAGLCAYNQSDSCLMDSWEGGNLAGTSTVPVGQALETNTAQTITPFKTNYPPVVASSNTTNGTSLSGGVALNMPSGITAGDLLIIFASNDNTGGTNMGVSGWTQLFHTQYTGNVVSHGAWAKIAAGSDTATLTGAAQDYAACVIRVTNHGVTSIASDLKVGTVATGSDTAPNPPSLNSGSVKKWLWLVSNGSDDDDNATTYAPASYTAIAQVESAQSTSSTMIQVASRVSEVQTEDPGTFTLAAAEEWIAQTLAIPPAASGLTRTVNQVSETGTSQAISKRKIDYPQQVTETDTAGTVRPARRKSVQQVAETDTAQSIAHRKFKVVGQSSTSDTAQLVTRYRPTVTIGIGKVTETSTSQTVSEIKRKTVSSSLETSTLGALSKVKIDHPIQTVETDVANAISHRKVRSVAGVIEVNTSSAITENKRKALGQASETNSAGTVSERKRKTVGTAIETDTAQLLSPRGVNYVLQTVEIDSSQPVSKSKRKAVNIAVETSTSVSITHSKVSSVNQASEEDTAGIISMRLPIVLSVGQAQDNELAGVIVPLLIAVTVHLHLHARDLSLSLYARDINLSLSGRDRLLSVRDRNTKLTLEA